MDEIRCVVLDVDGVLTDGRLLYGGCTEPLRAFHVHDGLAIHWYQKLGGMVAILSAKTSLAVETRAAELEIHHVVQGSGNKLADLKPLLKELALGPEQVAMVADDLLDLPAMRFCGYPIAVANAVDEVKSVARYVTQRAGGDGAVREALEHLMRLDGRWARVLEHYGVQATVASGSTRD